VTASTDSLTIENVVAATGLDQELDLEQVAQDLEGVSYDPDVFPGLVYRVEAPKASCLLFRSGKIVCTGAKSIPNTEQALHQLFEILEGLGLPVPEEPDIEVQNIVTSGDIGERLNLNAVAVGLGLERVEYEPEQFPGLVYRLPDQNVVALLFGSGKLVVTGGKSPDVAERGLETVYEELSALGLVG
jgi:transcription initiation factor TFIID TATA-box-binding protein